jgi:NAD(P)-dependent dehydrogenase (short-subunit alcohol dehydrogenase family)
MKMSNRKVLVTGSDTGIGREIALEFAREGAAVAFHYPHDDQGVVPAVRDVISAGGKAHAFRADFNHIDQVRRLGNEAVAFLGGLDVLINNSGITMNMPFEKVTPKQYDTLYNVNIRASFFLTQTVLPALTSSGSGGVVINIASIHAFEGLPQHTVYAGTKGAVVAYTRALAIELARKGVRVNAIAPGAVPVENYQKAGLTMDWKEFNDLIPAGFYGTPLDIARVALFLASDDARYIVGQTVVVDGGTTAWLPFSNAFKKSFDAHFGRGYVAGV